ncbi:MAG: WbqC family protein [Candidatus Nanoarchaeia archaeon]
MYERVMAAHQPNFIPYLGFFDKMQNSDIFVIRDEVLFVERDFHHRNRIRINGNDNNNNPQFKWLTVPVRQVEDYIKHQTIKRETKQKNRPWNVLMLHDIKVNYERSPYFKQYFPLIEGIFDNSDEKLITLNMKIINFLREAFGIKTEVIMATDLGLKPEHYEKSDASEDLVAICKAVKANVYLSGAGGKNYLNLEPFKREGIEVRFQDYKHPVYPQQYPGFLPYMGAIDALFCVGKIPKSPDGEN